MQTSTKIILASDKNHSRHLCTHMDGWTDAGLILPLIFLLSAWRFFFSYIIFYVIQAYNFHILSCSHNSESFGIGSTYTFSSYAHPASHIISVSETVLIQLLMDGSQHFLKIRPHLIWSLLHLLVSVYSSCSRIIHWLVEFITAEQYENWFNLLNHIYCMCSLQKVIQHLEFPVQEL